MSRKLTSVAVIAYFNGEKHIQSAINSVLSQTVPVGRIIVVDDGSAKASSMALESIVQKVRTASSLPIDLVRISNSGQGIARNVGVEKSTGDVIFFLDQDDEWSTSHVEKLLEPITRSKNVNWVFSDFDIIDLKGSTTHSRYLFSNCYEPPATSISEFLSRDLMMLPSASAIRRKAFENVGGFDGQFRGYEDDDLFVRLLISGGTFVYIDRPLLKYRIHESNSSGNSSFHQSRMRFYEKYKAFYSTQSDVFRNSLAPRISSLVLEDLVTAYKSNNRTLAASYRSTLREIYQDRGWGAVLHLKFWMTSLPRPLRAFHKIIRIKTRVIRKIQHRNHLKKTRGWA